MDIVTEVVAALGTEQRQALAHLLGRRDLTPRQRERAELVKAAGPGQSLGAIAAWSGRETETVRHWLRRYWLHGLDGLAAAPRAGRAGGLAASRLAGAVLPAAQ